jgi:hypothetical protein
MIRTVCGIEKGVYFTIFESDLKDRAKELGISVSKYCSLWDLILTIHKGDPEIDIPAKIKRLVKILKG